MFEVLSARDVRRAECGDWRGLARSTYDKTFEKSADGDMTKLSPFSDHDIRCEMVLSSSMLCRVISLQYPAKHHRS